MNLRSVVVRSAIILALTLVLPLSASAQGTVCAPEGGFCAFSGTRQVAYGANGTFVYKTLSEGVSCTNGVFGDPLYGTVKQCFVSSATTPTEVAPDGGVGPQSSIRCPTGAIDIWPGGAIQGTVNAYPGGTAFCLRAGTHALTSSIAPKTGDVFVGEYGAVLDGSGWTTGDDTQAAFRAHNQDIDRVTIRNLVIRNMPQRGIHAYYTMSDRWTIENNEIASNKNVALVFPGESTIRNNNIHHNPYSGYMGPYAHNTTLEGNEIAYNGWQQKVTESANVTFRNNFVHHNYGGGIWYDSDNTGALVEGNRVEDNGWMGIFYEISSGAIIRDNTIRRNGDTGLYLSVSKNTQIYNNTLEHNFRGITYFLNCASLGGGQIGFDLTNNTAHDNTITVGTQSGALATAINYINCSAAQVAPYLNGSKNLTFSHNVYHVPSLTTVQYWLWNNFMFWNQWLAIPQDATSTVSQ
jgi:parallel beta-helix repeat protein